MHVPLTPETLEQLREEATRRGIGPAEYARQIIEQRLSASQTNGPRQSVLEMLDEWDREDETDDRTEIAVRQQDFEQFKDAINASHSSHRKIYP